MRSASGTRTPPSRPTSATSPRAPRDGSPRITKTTAPSDDDDEEETRGRGPSPSEPPVVDERVRSIYDTTRACASAIPSRNHALDPITVTTTLRAERARTRPRLCVRRETPPCEGSVAKRPSATGSVSDTPIRLLFTCPGMSSGPSYVCVKNSSFHRSGTTALSAASKRSPRRLNLARTRDAGGGVLDEDVRDACSNPAPDVSHRFFNFRRHVVAPATGGGDGHRGLPRGVPLATHRRRRHIPGVSTPETARVAMLAQVDPLPRPEREFLPRGRHRNGERRPEQRRFDVRRHVVVAFVDVVESHRAPGPVPRSARSRIQRVFHVDPNRRIRVLVDRQRRRRVTHGDVHERGEALGRVREGGRERGVDLILREVTSASGRGHGRRCAWLERRRKARRWRRARRDRVRRRRGRGPATCRGRVGLLGLEGPWRRRRNWRARGRRPGRWLRGRRGGRRERRGRRSR